VQRNGGQTLRKSGALMNSISFDVPDNQHVTWGPGGTAAPYAAIQNFGGTITAKNGRYLKFFIPGIGWIQKHEVTIPARPYDYVSPQAQNTFSDILLARIFQQ
jgi:phage gpG-like protein